MMALRALIPAGFMPDLAAAHGGSFQLVMCTPDGLKAVTVDANGEPGGPAPTPTPSHELCAFAAPVMGLEACPLALVVAWRGAVELIDSRTVRRDLSGPLRWNWHGARAPPVRLASSIPLTI